MEDLGAGFLDTTTDALTSTIVLECGAEDYPAVALTYPAEVLAFVAYFFSESGAEAFVPYFFSESDEDSFLS